MEHWGYNEDNGKPKHDQEIVIGLFFYLTLKSKHFKSPSPTQQTEMSRFGENLFTLFPKKVMTIEKQLEKVELASP